MTAGLLGKLLLNEGLIDAQALKSGMEKQAKSGERLGAALVSLGLLSEKDMLRILSLQLGIPCLMPHEYPRTPPSIEPRPSVMFLKRYRVVPVERKDGVLKVAAADPLDPYPKEALRTFTGLDIETVLGAEKDILDAIEAHYGDGAVTFEKIIEGMGEKDGRAALWETEDVEQLKDLASEAPIINLVNILIAGAVEKRASDIHIEPFDDLLNVRYRVDGILYKVESLPKRLQAAIASRIKIMAKLNIAESRLPQDGRIKTKAAGKEMDIRVSTIPTIFGESVVMRLLDPNSVFSLETLGFSEANRKAFDDLITQPHGIILVTGPTGSGKSTTLYAAVSKIDTVEKKAITIEDPVEYKLNGVNQIQVKPKIGLSFANGLRSIVRQDPDVIMVGEIRDTETADIAIHSALTGHLILSTLHTNDAPGAVARLMDMGVESYLISSSLLGVLAQRLVRVICPHCKEPYRPGSEVMRRVSVELDRALSFNGNGAGARGLELYRGAGCDHCADTGYRGRTGIFEFMPVTDGLREIIVEKKGANLLRLKAMEDGMVTLREDGWDKVLKGITTVEEISRVSLVER